jgi:hypothetical protein
MKPRALFIGACLALSSACTGTTDPAPVLSFELIEGEWDLYRVNGKRVPVTLGICFLEGCAVVVTMNGGSLRVDGQLPGKWSIEIDETDPSSGVSIKRKYVGSDVEVNASGSLILIADDAEYPITSNWSGEYRKGEIILQNELWSYAFRRKSQSR